MMFPVTETSAKLIGTQPNSRSQNDLNVLNDLNVPDQLLRSSLVSRHTTSKGESWKARASEPKGCVQVRTAEVTAPGVDRVGPTRHRPIARAWKGSALGF